mgnify:CR=1 FL=1
MPSSSLPPKLAELAPKMLPAPAPARVRGVDGVYAGAPVDPTALAAYRIGEALPEPLVDAGARVEDQAFTLTIEATRIAISGAPAGRLYAVQALRQLLMLSGNGGLPCGTIEDRPDLADRGYMMDVSRNRVPTRAELLHLLDLLLLLRFNHLELYLEHAFAYEAHREVWDGWSPITPADVRWLDREAAARGIELVPNQNSFGHMTRWLVHDRYRPLAEAPDGFTDPWGSHRDYPFSLSPVAEGVDAFLAGLYDELLPCFTSTRFNVGLDETFDLGQGRSAAAVRSEADRGRLYLEFLRRVQRMVSDRGYQMLFWGDIIQNHPELVPELPRGVCAVEWGYEADHDFDARCRRLADAGVAFLVAPGTSVWNSAGGRLDTARANIRRAVEAAGAHGAAGMLLTDWGDNGHIPPPSLAYPAIALAGAAAWNPRAGADDGTLSAWLSSCVLSEEAGTDADRLSRAMRLLNTLDRHEPRVVPNASILGVSLFTYDVPAHARFLAGGEADTVRATAEQAREAREAADAVTARSEQGDLIRRELLFAADLAVYAAGLLERHRRAAGHAPAEAASDAAWDDATLCVRFRDLCDRMPSVWLRRSRPGGLERSLALLRRPLDELHVRCADDG